MYSHSLIKKPFIVLVVLAIAFLLTAPWTSGYCRSAFDSDDDTVDVFDEDESVDDSHPSADTADETPGGAETPGLATRFIKDATFTLGYQFSYGTTGDPAIVTNYGYLRQESEVLFGGNYFLRFDGKLSLVPRTDHRADAKDRDLFIDARLRELYLQAGYDDFSIKLGNQIIVWGKADTSAITDVISPRDLSEFIFVDLEDSRFGQFMLSADIYRDSLNAFFFVAPYPDTDEEPDGDTRYDRKLPGMDMFLVRREEPQFGDFEYGIRLDKNYSKTEVSLMAGRFFVNSPVYHHRGDFENAMPVVIKGYPDYGMAGAGVTYAMQSILLKFEAAYKSPISLQGMGVNSSYRQVESEIMDLAAGMEYNANGRYLMTFEIANRHIFGDMAGLSAFDRDSTSFYYTFTTDFWNQTLALEYVFYYRINDRSLFHDAQLTYDLTDSIEIKTSFAFFDIPDEESLLWQYREEDRITFEVQCFF